MRGIIILILSIGYIQVWAKNIRLWDTQPGMVYHYGSQSDLLFKDSIESTFFDTFYTDNMSGGKEIKDSIQKINRSGNCNFIYYKADYYEPFDSTHNGYYSTKSSSPYRMKYTTTISPWAELGWINPEALHDNPDLAAEFGHALVNDSLKREGRSPSTSIISLKEIWIRGLGIVERKHLPNTMSMDGKWFFSGGDNPCNPHWDDYHLSLITLGTDTLYDASKVVTPVQNPLPAGLRLEQGLAQIPSAWLNLNQNPSVTWLSANGQSQDLSWKQDAKHLSVQIPPQLKQGWIRVAQGQNWRVYRVLNSH